MSLNAQTYLLEKKLLVTSNQIELATEKAMKIYEELQKFSGNVSMMYQATKVIPVQLNDSVAVLKTANVYTYDYSELVSVYKEVKRIESLILKIMNNGVTDLDDFKAKVTKITTFLDLKDVVLEFIKRYPTYNESRNWLTFKALFEVEDVK